MRHRLARTLVTVITVAAVTTVVVQAPAVSAAGACSDPGTDVPVLLVHGFRSKPSDFTDHGESKLPDRLGAIPGVVVSSFDYSPHADRWVTDPLIGDRLADTIACLGDSSAQNGGPGKVVVIAHSMGGLATREAVAKTVDGVPVSQRVSQIVTIGTPHRGSWVEGVFTGGAVPEFVIPAVRLIYKAAEATCRAGTGGKVPEVCGFLGSAGYEGGLAMRPGSRQLRELPDPPDDVPLTEVSGTIRVTAQILNGPKVLITDDVGDVLVKADSARVYGERPGETGKDLTCEIPLHRMVGFSTAVWADCAHGGLLYNAEVQAFIVDTVSAIATPTLGRAEAMGPDATGFGEVAPDQFSGGGVSNGSVDSIAWNNWGESEANGRGTGYYVAPGEIMAATEALPASVVAFDLGMCEGRRAYRKVAWFFPDRGEELDRDQAWDVCTGEASASASTAEGQLVLHPDAVGPLKLGMTVAEAVATGFVTEPNLEEGCGFGYPADPAQSDPEAGSWVAQFVDFTSEGVSRLVSIDSSLRTPEGLGVGSLVSEIIAAYPTAGELQEGEFDGFELLIPIGGGGYKFTFDQPDGPATGLRAGTPEGLSLTEGCA